MNWTAGSLACTLGPCNATELAFQFSSVQLISVALYTPVGCGVTSGSAAAAAADGGDALEPSRADRSPDTTPLKHPDL